MLFIYRRYRDKERSHSSSDDNVVTTAPTFKADDKKTINLRAKSSTSSVKQSSKKIDLGAATNYGKSTDLGINSPTHRNTHSEDLFGNELPTTIKTCIDIENIFDNDDFNPRAEEVTSADFGDFESAFGKSNTVPTPETQNNEFADFSIFPSTSKALAHHLDDNFICKTPNTTIVSDQKDINNTDMFGNNVITFASQTPANSALLDDFVDLKISSGMQGELFKRFKY